MVGETEKENFFRSSRSLWLLLPLILCLLFWVMSQVPPSGQWVNDASTPVFPTIKYTHINDPFGSGYKRSDLFSSKGPIGQDSGAQGRTPYSWRFSFSEPTAFTSNAVSAKQNDQRLSAETRANCLAVKTMNSAKSSLQSEDMLSTDSMNTSMHTYRNTFGTTDGTGAECKF